jgi:TonB family protein
VSLLTFNLLVAYILQSTAVAALALGLERLLPAGDASSRRGLWLMAFCSALIAPALWLMTPARESFATASTVVVDVEALSRTAPGEARLAVVWFAVAGAILLAGWRLCGLVRLHRYAAEAEIFDPGPEVAELEGQIGARAEYRISVAVEGPLMFGWRRPVIVLPVGFTAMPVGERRAILAHELTHVRRGDWLKLLAEEAVRCLVWFTPAVHIVVRRGRVAREMRTDILAVEATRDRGSYLNALVAIARRPIRADALAAPLFLEPRSLKGRVAALLEDHPMSYARRCATLAAIMFLLPVAHRYVRDAFPSALHAAQQNIHKVGGDVKAPRLLTKVDPAYTDEASEAKLEGTVLLSAEVHPDGKAYNIRVTGACQSPCVGGYRTDELGMGLDEAAVFAVEQWTFEPGTKDGKPVAVAASIEVNFRLE